MNSPTHRADHASSQHRTPKRKLLSALTTAALLSMAGMSHADAASPISLQFSPIGDKAHPDELAFDIPLAAGESISDIRYLANGAETSLMGAFELTPTSGGVTARFLLKLDFTPYLGQTLTLKVIKSDGTFAAQREEQLLLKIVSAQDLQHDLKLVAVTDGTALADSLEFVIPGAVNLTLDDLLLISAKQTTSVKALLTLAAQRGGDTRASLPGLDLDTVAGQPLELRATKSFKSGAAPISQKLLLTTQTAKDFSKDTLFALPTSGDSQPDPFTLDLAAGANVEVQDITLGGSSLMAFFNLTRAADGSLSAKLKRDVDFDAVIGQPFVLTVQKGVGGVAYTQKLTAYAQLPTPKLLAKDDGTLSATSGLSSTATVRNLQFVLYSDAAGKSEAARNAKGAFADLSAATDYWLGTVAEASDRAALKSPLLAVKTDPANPAAFTFTPVSASPNTQATSNTITVSGIHGKAAVSVKNGDYAIDGGAWSNQPGTVSNGQKVQVRGVAANGYSTAKTVTLTIGMRSADFVITTYDEPVYIYTPPPADVTPPTTSAHSVANLTDTTADINATINESGTGYYVVQLAATAAPSVAQVVAGQDGTGGAALKSGNAAMTANTQKTFSVSGLTASTSYKAYFVAKDAANNTQAAAVSDALNTAAPADSTPPATPTLALSDGTAGDGTGSAGYTNSTTANLTIGNDTDNVGVTGWFIAESSSAPAAGAGGWVGARPTTATLTSGDGVKTLYVWTKDAAGNVSNAGSGTIELGTVAPGTATFVTTMPDQKTTAYSNLILSGDRSFAGTTLGVVSRFGGTVGTVTIDGSGQINIDSYITPGVNPDYLDISGTDKYGNTISIARRVNLPN